MRERAVLWAVIIGLVAGAVGVALVASGGDGDKPPRLPALALAGDGAERSSAFAADMPVRPGSVEYRVKGDLPDLPDRAAAWTLGRSLAVEQVASLAKALGVSGQVQNTEYGWLVKDGDRTLTVDKQAGHPWSYASVADCGGDPEGSVSSDGAVGCAKAGVAVSSPPATTVEPCPMPPCAPDQVCAQVCEPPVPQPAPQPVPEPVRPADLPSKDEAERIGRQVLESAGLDLDGAVLRVDDGFTQWYVSAEPRVGGLPTISFAWSATVGPKGEVQGANGWLGSPARGEEYPLAGVQQGLERLRTGGGWAPYGGPRPMAVDTSEPIAPQIVTITGVRLGLMFAPTADGDELLLVPAYLFDLEDGGPIPVIAVADEFLPKPPEPAPVPEPAPAPGGSGQSCSGSASAVAPGGTDQNQPLTVEVCVSPSNAKVGEEVVFTVVATDPDGPVADDECSGPRFAFGDERSGTVQCEASCAAPAEPPPKQPGKLVREFRHAYDKPGTYTAAVTIGAGCNAAGSAGSGEVQVTVR